MKVKGVAYISFKEDPEKAVVYRIIPSVDIVKKSKAGVCTPSTITFSVYKVEGGKQTQPAFDNSGVKMRVRKSNGSWENSINWTTKSYTIDSTTEWVDAQLFVNNSTWLDADLLDSKRVPVIIDGTDGSNGKDGQNGKDGDAAVQYWMETDTPIIHYDTAKVTNTASFNVSCKKKVGSGVTADCNEFRFSLERYNGTSWTAATIYSKRYMITIGTSSTYTRYRLRAIDDSDVTVCEIIIEAVFDGAIGPAGAKGAIYFFRGEWNNLETYIRTDDVIHYVVYNEYAYEPKKASVTGGSNPLADTQAGEVNWHTLGKYDVIATKVLLANFALIAGGVFWNNKLMSQWGVNNSGGAVNNYTAYSEDAAGNENGTFHPNILIDFLKGYIKATDGEFNGKISIANGKILLNKDGSGQLANGNVVWDANGNITYRGKFETSASGRRVVIDNANANITIYNAVGDEILNITFDNAITGNHEFARIFMKTKVGTGGEEWNTIVSPLQLTLYRKLANGTTDISFTAYQGGGVTMKNLPISRPPAGQNIGVLWRDGETLKVGI